MAVEVVRRARASGRGTSRSPAASSSTSLTGAASIACTAACAPPEYAKIPPTGQTMSGSVSRTDRIGPTTSVDRDWNIARKRVIWPSTTSFHTMSAASSPVCGRASGVFSIFTLSTGRVRATPLGSGNPVSGATGDAFVVVEVVRGLAWRPWCLPRHRARGGDERDRGHDRGEPQSVGHMALSAAIRSSSGGWVSNARLSHEPFFPFFLLVTVERLLDPHLRGGPGGVVHDRLVVLELLERRDQPRRVPGELHAGRVGEQLTAAAHRELHELRGERRQDQQREREDDEDEPDRAGVVVVPATRPPAEPHEPHARGRPSARRRRPR